MFWKRGPDPRAQLESMIGDYELPSFSASAVSTLSLLRNDAPLAEVAEGIMADPGLSVRVLRTANSAAFGLRQEATNLRYAVNLLGRSRVESLVLVAAVRAALPAPGIIDLIGFWRTASRRACLARQLAAVAHPSLSTECFTAGLLQDLAVPVLAASHPDSYVALYRGAQADASVPLHEREQEAFGYDHAEVGALIAESWDLPQPLIEAIADHHRLGQRAPGAVQAVAEVRHGDPPDDLVGFREHCDTHLPMVAAKLDDVLESAEAEAAALLDSMQVEAATA